MNAFYKFAMTVMRLIMPLWYKIEAEGLENLPDESGYLFVSNHRSMADPILIGVQNPDTQFCFLAKQELFSSGFIGWLLKKLGAVAIDRGAGDITALEEIEFRLQNGENALIFPEGTRSKDGKLGHFKTGAALIAAQTGVPVVPVAISFDDESLHFRSRIYIRYGAPFEIPRIDPADPSPVILKQIRQKMTNNVSALLTMNTEASGGSEVIPAKPEKTGSAARNKESEVTEKDMSRNRKHHHSNDPLKQQPEKNNAAEKAGEAVNAAEEAVTEAAEAAAAKAADAAKTVADSAADEVAEVRADAEDTAEELEKAADDALNTEAVSDDADIDGGDDFGGDEEYDEEDDFDDDEDYDDEDDFDDDEEYDDEDDFDDDEEYDDEDDFDDDEDYDDEDDFDDDEDYDDEDDFDDDEAEDEEEDETFEEPAEKRSFLPFKFRNPFRKSDDDEDEDDFDDDDEDDEDDYDDEPDDDFSDDDDDLPEGAKSEDTFFQEDLAQDDEDDEPEEDQPKKGGLFSGFSLKNPFGKKSEPEDEEDEDEEEEIDDEDDFDDLDEEPVKVPVRPVQRPAASAGPKPPVRRPAPARTPAKDEFYEEDEFSNEYEDEDDEEAAVGRRIDYGRIALILTFVILAIFAFDFCRRLWNDWRSQKGMLDIPSQSSAMVESMNGEESLGGSETPAVTTLAEGQQSLETETTTLETEVTSTSGSKAVVDNRTTQTVSVSSNDMHSGSLMLIDALHQQTAAPALITLGDTGVANVATVVAPTYHIDSEAGAQLNKWLTDFNTATGLGKQIWIYGAVEVGATPPYSQQINERTTGLTVDFGISAPAGSGILFNPYTADGNYAWLNEHAAEYGFVLRYPADKAEKTGANGLSWHYRYVGVPHAAYMAANNLCLEEYLEELEKHTADQEHLTVTVGETEYEMFYVPMAATGTETEIKFPVSPDGSTPLISGDNKGGFVVACVKG